MMTMFLIHVSLPGWNVTSSITGGMIKARKELANAPMREMSRSRCGIRADNPPETERMKSFRVHKASLSRIQGLLKTTLQFSRTKILGKILI